MRERRREWDMDLAGSGDPDETYPTTAGEVAGNEKTIWPAVGDELDLATEQPTEGADVQTETSRGHLDFVLALLAIGAAATAPRLGLVADAADLARASVAAGLGAVLVGCGWSEYRYQRIALPGRQKGRLR